LDLSGSLTAHLPTKTTATSSLWSSTSKRHQQLDLSQDHHLMQASVLQVYLATQVDGVILCFDLNNLKSLDSLPRYMAIVESMVGRHR
jgi:hypothetical protein